MAAPFASVSSQQIEGVPAYLVTLELPNCAMYLNGLNFQLVLGF